MSIVEELGRNSEVEVRRISKDEWDAHWTLVEDQLDCIPQYWEDYWTKEYIYNAVRGDVWQAWGFGGIGEIRMVVMTEVVDLPANRFLCVRLAFGNSLDRLLPLMEAALEEFAVAAGCGIVEIVGRPGWERKLPRFKRHAVLMKARPRMGVH